MRIGINGSGRMLSQGVEGVLESLGRAESLGFDSYWVAQVGLIDALALTGAHGDTGSDMAVGTAVITADTGHTVEFGDLRDVAVPEVRGQSVSRP